MVRINETDINVEEVLAALDIEIVGTRGSWVDSLCPFHEESRPSFSININSGHWVCRHQTWSGSLVDLVADLKEFKKEDSFIWLRGFKAKQYSSYDLLKKLVGTPTEDRSEELINWVSEFHDLPTNTMTEYWFERGFTSKTMYDFDVRYDEERKGIIWPVKDEDANIIGFIRRYLPGINPKYKYPGGFKRCLFPMNKFGGESAYLVEGPLDSIWLHQHGWVGGLAMLGSGLTQDQIDWLNRKVRRVIIIPDNDAAGEVSVRTLRNQLSRLELTVARVPDEYKDVQELSRGQIGRMLTNTKSILSY